MGSASSAAEERGSECVFVFVEEQKIVLLLFSVTFIRIPKYLHLQYYNESRLRIHKVFTGKISYYNHPEQVCLPYLQH